jgi:hypothetical protein
MQYLRQSTASQEVLIGPFLDDTDGKTAETALTIANTDIKVWKTGGTTEASKNSGGGTHIAAGRYYAVLDATDTDTIGPLEINVAVSGALPVKLRCCVLDEAVYDALFGTVALATATNITAATGVTLAGVTHTGAVIPTVTTTGTATAVTTVNGLAANVITAASINANALDGKGNWNVNKTGYTLTATTGLGNQTANITGNLSGSVGSVTGAVGSVTAAVTAGTVSDKTGYSLTATTGLGNQTANITGNLSGSVGTVTGAVGSVATAGNEAIADAVINRNIQGGSNTGRTVRQALAALRNKVVVSGGTMTVYATDDSASEWTASVTTTAGNPITTIDPA